MKKIYSHRLAVPLIVLLFALVSACNNSTDNKTTNTPPKNSADTLMHDVMEDHDVSMAKMDKLRRMQEQLNKVLDSISKLPEKARQAALPFRDKVQGVLFDINTANSRMETWMNEFNMDSAVNDVKQRVNYLTEEKFKISDIKENMISSLNKADSVIRSKF